MNRFQPALLGGLFIGVLSSLPYIRGANCCCLWVICGGLLVTYLLQQKTPEPIQVSDALLQGLLAGAIGAVMSVTMVALTSDPAQGLAEMQRAMDQPNIPPEFRDVMTRVMSGNNLMLIVAMVTIPLYAVFGMLGSLLGVAFFKKKAAPPAAQA
jgi:hypothetical protein